MEAFRNNVKFSSAPPDQRRLFRVAYRTRSAEVSRTAPSIPRLPTIPLLLLKLRRTEIISGIGGFLFHSFAMELFPAELDSRLGSWTLKVRGLTYWTLDEKLRLRLCLSSVGLKVESLCIKSSV